MKMRYLFVLLSIVFSNISYAQPLKLSLYDNGTKQIGEAKNDHETPRLSINYFKGYIFDTKNILTSPLRWKKYNWVKASLVTGITAGFYAYDHEIKDWSQGNRSNSTDRIAEFAKPFGNGFYTLPPLGAFYFYGRFFKDPRASKVSLLSIKSFVISGIFTQVVKSFGHRHRPSSGTGQNRWDGPGISSSNLSFPSGHSSSAFAVGTVIASEYKDKWFIPPLAYGISTLTALSRINDNAHWASDVFFGSAIGYFTAKAIVAMHRYSKNKKLTLLPVSNGKESLALIIYKF